MYRGVYHNAPGESEEYNLGFNVAIDGPAGAGKSTIAKLVAKEAGFIYVDTGAMYRALAYYFLEKELDANDKEKIIEASYDADISINYQEDSQQVFLNGANITDKLRDEKVGKMTSLIAAVPEVRQHLLKLQRSLARDYDVVMDGRDIGTEILPNADVKIFLTASVTVRAKRRYLELTEKGVSCNLEEIKKDIVQRDYRDTNRDVSPLRQADDAILLDSSDLSIGEVVKKIIGYITARDASHLIK